ncbi:MAG: F420H(2):quinone oxidoreductase [Archaeoglobales archaeon]|jgi:NADH-quinone oxidoreductase subunit K|nr:F420H(2):quinone oxidoreductase [Archaeoglobales archaeon]TDA25220.1 MAG: F420H(2):quinone oxidoreductase [Archaeoglobi archaeon]TDA26133.1 MAG: F420H(2):quinone oxidoreductase [Archaeoglobi archaeon]TDA30016.1 MAG: F420H(2):quinone oxidoreductase [Archaeoglobi archaeon]
MIELGLSLLIALVAFLITISAKDIVRLLIGLELMFGGVFLAIVPLFAKIPDTAFAILVVAIFTSSAELLILISAIVILDRLKKGIEIQKVSVGGDSD